MAHALKLLNYAQKKIAFNIDSYDSTIRSHIASNWPATLGRNFSTSPQYTVSLRSVAVYTENSLLSEKVKEIDIGVMELY